MFEMRERTCLTSVLQEKVMNTFNLYSSGGRSGELLIYIIIIKEVNVLIKIYK